MFRASANGVKWCLWQSTHYVVFGAFCFVLSSSGSGGTLRVSVTFGNVGMTMIKRFIQLLGEPFFSGFRLSKIMNIMKIGVIDDKAPIRPGLNDIHISFVH